MLSPPGAVCTLRCTSRGAGACAGGGSLEVRKMKDFQRLLDFSSEHPFIGTALGVAVLVLVMVFFGLPRAIASAKWPSTEGEIISSYVEEVMNADPEGGGGVSWHPRVSYRYSVVGREYTSKNIEAANIGLGTSHQYAREVVERYPMGAQVKVHYDPGNPGVAVLEPGIPNNIGLLGIVIMVAVIGTGALLLATGILGIATDLRRRGVLGIKTRTD